MARKGNEKGGQKKLYNLSIVQRETTIEVEHNGAGKRIDKLVQNRLEWMTRGLLKQFAAEERLLRNGRPVPGGRKAKEGDILTVIHPEPWEDLSEMDQIHWGTIFEDEHLLVLNKPPHVVVHPVGGYRYTTLLNALHKHYLGDKELVGDDDPVPRLVHRIDKETSGVLVVAFDRDAHGPLGKLIESRDPSVKKEYLALVEGSPEWDKTEIELRIGAAPDDTIRLRRAVVEADKGGQHAHTSVSVVERFVHYSLVRCRLHTGRQHQIRVHMAAVGHPLVGDHLYGVRDELRALDVMDPDAAPFRQEGVYLDESVPKLEAADRIRELDSEKRREYWEIEAGKEVFREGAGQLLLSRSALHCARMAFPHPITDEPIDARAPLTADFELALKVLREHRDSVREQ